MIPTTKAQADKILRETLQFMDVLQVDEYPVGSRERFLAFSHPAQEESIDLNGPVACITGQKTLSEVELGVYAIRFDNSGNEIAKIEVGMLANRRFKTHSGYILRHIVHPALEFSYSPDCPLCLRDLGHTIFQHDQALERVSISSSSLEEEIDMCPRGCGELEHIGMC